MTGDAETDVTGDARAASARHQLVFGYGSLVARAGFTPRRRADPRGRVCDLVGFRRRFGVAMDNMRTIPGYKYYVDAATGERPSVQVAFLDVSPDAGAAVNGLLFPVSDAELAALDERERSYRRVDVTDAVRPPPTRPTSVFVGSDSARRRFQAGLASGSLVVGRGYLRRVEASFEALGADEAVRYRTSTEPPPCPVVELERIDVPPGASTLAEERRG